MTLSNLMDRKKKLLIGDISDLFIYWKLKHFLTTERFERIQFLTTALSRRFDYVY